MNKRFTLVGVLVSLLLAIGLPFLTDAIFIHLTVVMLTVLLSLAGLAGAGILFALASWRGWHTARRRAGTALSVSLIGLMQWGSVPVANHLNAQQSAAARAYCDSLVPELERFHEAHGRYPERIDELSAARAAPDFLRRQKFYWVGNAPAEAAGKSDQFGFQFYLPSSPPAVIHRYDAATREWRMED